MYYWYIDHYLGLNCVMEFSVLEVPHLTSIKSHKLLQTSSLLCKNSLKPDQAADLDKKWQRDGDNNAE